MPSKAMRALLRIERLQCAHEAIALIALICWPKSFLVEVKALITLGKCQDGDGVRCVQEQIYFVGSSLVLSTRSTTIYFSTLA